MIDFRAFASTEARKFPTSTVHDVFGCVAGQDPDPHPGEPEGFVVYFEPGRHERAHFHDVNQFQIFICDTDTPGYFRRGSMTPLMLLYTDAFSTYGPFGSEGEFTLCTLRPRPSSVHGHLPEDRDKLRRLGRRRQRLVDLSALVADAHPEPGARQLIDSDADGISAVLYRVPPGGEMALAVPQNDACGGTYYFVLQGQLLHAGDGFGPCSVGWHSAQDFAGEAIRVGAGDAAPTSLLELRFPRPAEDIGVR